MKYSETFNNSLIKLIESQIEELGRDFTTVEHSITERAIQKEIEKLKGDIEYLKNHKAEGDTK